MARTRTHEIGPTARPVAVPEDLGDASLPMAEGQVELPLHIRWSGPSITYNLDDPDDRARVYEQVLREGTEDDVRLFIDPNQLADIFDELVLPLPVRQAWTAWLEGRGAPAAGDHDRALTAGNCGHWHNEAAQSSAQHHR